MFLQAIFFYVILEVSRKKNVFHYDKIEYLWKSTLKTVCNAKIMFIKISLRFDFIIVNRAYLNYHNFILK